MQRLQENVFSIVKTTSLSPAVFSYLQPTEEFADKTPRGGIFKDSRYGWLALGPKFCVIDLKTGLKIAAWTFGTILSNNLCTVTSVIELPTPLMESSQQLVISIESETCGGMVCIFHVNGSHILRCIQTEAIVTNLGVFDDVPDGIFSCFDGVIVAGTKSGEIFAFDLNRESLLQALKYTSQGCENLVRNEINATTLTFLPLNSISEIEEQREVAIENGNHIAVLLNENSFIDSQYIFWNPDGTVRMKAKRDHIWVSTLQYIPQLGSVTVGYNFGAFQIWNLITLKLEFTSQINVDCLPVTHFGFQEPCDDPRAFCYLWVVYSALDRFEEEEFPLSVMYSLTYHGKRMLSESKCLYQEFLNSTIRFQVDLSSVEGVTSPLIGGRCIACHTYSIPSTLGDEGEDSVLNICQLVWECWGNDPDSPAQYGMLLFDLDQWYKDQMPVTQQLRNNTFMSAEKCGELPRDTAMLDAALAARSLSQYAHAARLEEHFYPNSLQYSCVCLSTSDACVISTTGVQRHIISIIDETGPTALIRPTELFRRCVDSGLTPLYMEPYVSDLSIEDQRKFLLSVALEARLSRFLKRCAHDWATGSHSGAGCTLPLLLDWCWQRAIDLKQNARELSAPLFTSSALPDRNVCRCLEHCVRQLTQLTSLLDSVLTKCCNLVVPDALSEIEEKFKCIGTVALYFQVVQWFLNVGLLPERQESLPYPGHSLLNSYRTRRLKLHRLHQNSTPDESVANKSCPLLYIDQLIDNECGGDMIHEMWRKSGSECEGLYPPPSLYSLLRLYLLPDIAEEHKHSLVLYLLVDYSMVYDELRYETVIRRLMQFPTMFGLSNTAIKATQAFWHLDHRDFDFALDQLQCLTGNTLSDWQHNVVLSALLAQRKTQAALHYLHVRKPAPIQTVTSNKNENDLNTSNNKVNDHDKLEDWQSCCNLYLARGLVFEALDVIRLCAQNVRSVDEKMQVLNFFYKGCRNTGQLSKILQIILLPFEEDVFIKYLESCNDQQTSDILVMYYLQQARYVEAQQYNLKLRQGRNLRMDTVGSLESLLEAGLDRDTARNVLVDVACSALPNITNRVVQCAIADHLPKESQVFAPRPMSVSVQAKSPKNTFTYKSSFIHDTIENASETWVNRPKTKRGIKRALNIEETPFICTPKLTRSRSTFHANLEDSIHLEGQTPPKKMKLDLTRTPKTPKSQPLKLSAKLTKEIESLLEMPDVESTPKWKIRRSLRESTPHSILKVKRSDMRDNSSPVDSRYLGDSDDEVMETASNHTHYSDSKHLRFTIPSDSDSGTPSPPVALSVMTHTDIEKLAGGTEIDNHFEMSGSHSMKEPSPFESPPKKLAIEKAKTRQIYKDNVKGRRSFSISANSSLSDDPNNSIESIADIPITLINPKYSGGSKDEEYEKEKDCKDIAECPIEINDSTIEKTLHIFVDSPRIVTSGTPKGRRGIRRSDKKDVPVPLITKIRSRSVTPERQDSPVPFRRISRSTTPEREQTPKTSPRLDSIQEQPKQEAEIELRSETTKLLRLTRSRSRSRTPERAKVQAESKLEMITESPKLETVKNIIDSPAESPRRRSLRSRSRTPETETNIETTTADSSPRSLRSRSRTPERDTKLLSLKTHTIEKSTKAKKPLSRLVLEANTFSKAKVGKSEETDVGSPNFSVSDETSILKDPSDSIIECTPVKDPSAQTSNLLDVSFSPIVDKSVLLSSTESIYKASEKDTKSLEDDRPKSTTTKTLNFTPISDTFWEKSVLKSYMSSKADDDSEHNTGNDTEMADAEHSAKPSESNIDISEDISSTSNKSVLKDVSSLITSDSEMEPIHDANEGTSKQFEEIISDMEEERATFRAKQQQRRIVEIEREIDELKDRIYEEGSEGATSESQVDSESGDSDIDSSTTEDSESERDEAVISINDSSTDEQEDESTSSSQSNNLQIVESVDVEVIIKPLDTEQTKSEREKKELKEKGQIQSNEYDMTIDDQEMEEDPEATLKDPSCNQEIVTVDVINEAEDSNIDIDPLNQANCSMMTDDNSVTEIEDSEIKLCYSQDDDEKQKSPETVEAEIKKDSEIKLIYVQDDNNEKKTTEEAVETKIESIHSYRDTGDIHTAGGSLEKKNEIIVYSHNVDDDNKIIDKDTKQETKLVNVSYDDPYNKTIHEVVQENNEVIRFSHNVADDSDIIDKAIKEKKEVVKVSHDDPDGNKTTVEVVQGKINIFSHSHKNIGHPKDDPDLKKTIINKPIQKKIDAVKTDSEMSSKVQDPETEKIVENIKRTDKETGTSETDVVDAAHTETPDANIVKSTDTDMKDVEVKVTEIKDIEVKDTQMKNIEVKNTEKAEKKVKTSGRTRSRAPSTSSNKSENVNEIPDIDSKTTLSRKRSKSTQSSKSNTESEKTSESETQTVSQVLVTPKRKGGLKIPSSETRIMTRRMSKELSESHLEESEEGSFATTPKRPISKSRRKTDDDNSSIISEESMYSKGSEKSESSDVQSRRPRRSILMNVKQDLSVIPESISEEASSRVDTEDLISEYSRSRRLTRKQKAVLESLLSPSQRPSTAGRVRSRRSTANTNTSSTSEMQEESPETKAFDVQPIDPISLLNKMDFEGAPDTEELHNKTPSPGSVSSDTSVKRKPRMSRAASETKGPRIPSQPSRRRSVDIAKLQSEVDSPASPGGSVSPSRARRASFHRAVEALSTPKGRRRSTDAKMSETGSMSGSPAQSVESDTPVTPSRRSRRVASTQSNTSTRSKKSAVD